VSVHLNTGQSQLTKCFALIISSDESQSKSQFNTLSLGENKTDVHSAENIDFFYR